MAKPKPKPVRIVATAFLIVTGLYVFCLITLTLAQRKLIYFPCKAPPAHLRAVAAEAGFKPWINPAGEAIGFFRLCETSRAPRCILLLHGNAGCAPDWFHYAEGFQAVEPVDFYILEYPGYGGRKGKPTQEGILAAAEDALGNIPANRQIFLVGESLGTGVATYLAGKHDREIAGVFLVAPYDMMTAVAASHLPLFPVKWMLRDKYPSSTWLQGYHGRLAVLLAGKDTVVPRELGQNLFDGYGGPKKLWVEPGATHEDVHRPKKEVFKNVLEFWDAG